MNGALRLLATALFLTASAGAADNAAVIEKKLTETEARLEQIKESGFIWRYTHPRIKEAREALAAGDLKKAAERAERATYETDRAYEQIEKAESVWQIAVPK